MMGILLFGLFCIVAGAWGLYGSKQPLDESARRRFDSWHRRVPFVFEDADYYQHIRYPLALLMIGIGCLILLGSAIALLA
jgi:hypothetical protein